MICLVLKIKDPLNYDVIFPDNDLGDDPKKQGVARVSRLDPVTLERGEEESHHIYRLKIDGAKLTTKEGVGKIIYDIVKWNDRNGGVFICDPHNIDAHGRILCDILDLVTRESVSSWLSSEYPERVYMR